MLNQKNDKYNCLFDQLPVILVKQRQPLNPEQEEHFQSQLLLLLMLMRTTLVGIVKKGNLEKKNLA